MKPRCHLASVSDQRLIVSDRSSKIPPIVTHPFIGFPHLASGTDDTSDTFRFICVCGNDLLLPRLVLDTSNPTHRGRDERPDPPTRSYTLANLNRALFDSRPRCSL